MFYDLAREWQWNFQDPASPLMEGLIDLHHNILFSLILIFGLVVTLISSLLYNQIVKNESLTNYLYISFIHLKYSPTIVLGASLILLLLIAWDLFIFCFFVVSFILVLTPCVILSVVSSFTTFYILYPIRVRLAINLSLYLFFIITFSNSWISVASCHCSCPVCSYEGSGLYTAFPHREIQPSDFIDNFEYFPENYLDNKRRQAIMGVVNLPKPVADSNIPVTSGATFPVARVKACRHPPSPEFLVGSPVTSNSTVASLPPVTSNSNTKFETASVIAQKKKANEALNLKIPLSSQVPVAPDSAQVILIKKLINETIYCRDMKEVARVSTSFVSRVYPDQFWPQSSAQFMNPEHVIHEVVDLFAQVPTNLKSESDIIRAALLTTADCNLKGYMWSTHPDKVFTLFMKYYNSLRS